MKIKITRFLLIISLFFLGQNDSAAQCSTGGSEPAQDVNLSYTCSNQTINAIGVNSQRRYTGITAEEWYTFRLDNNGTSPTCKKGRFMNSSNAYLGNEFDISDNITIQAPTGAAKINITSSGSWTATSTILNYKKASPTANIYIETDFTSKACKDDDVELTANWGPPNTECVRFDGENGERVDIQNNNLNDGGGSNISVEVWFRVNDKSLSRKQIIFEEGGGTNGINFYIQNSILYAAMWSESTGWADQRFTTTNFNSNEWHHVAIVLASSSSVTAYLDGAQFGTGTVPANMNAHGGENGIGSQHNGTEFHDDEGTSGDGVYDFSGDIADLRIWNVARSQQEIVDNRYADVSGTTGLLNHYTLDGTLADGTGNEVAGTFVDDAEYKDIFNFDAYNWEDASGGSVGTSAQTTTLSGPVAGGVYSVTVDLNGCNDLQGGSAFVNVLPDVTPSNPSEFSSNSPLCNDEDLDIDARFMVPGGEWVNFDGANDYVSLPNILNGVNSFSVSMWFKRDQDLYASSTTNHAIGNTLMSHSSNTNNDNFEIGTNGEAVEVYIDTDGGTDFTRTYEGAKIQNGVWYYLVFTYDESNASVYIDGNLLETKTDWNGQLDQVDQTTTVDLGTARGSNDNWGDFDGSIDEFRFFTSALTEAQIKDLMFTEMNASHPNWGTLDTYFDFNGDVDDRKNSNDGSLTNGASLSTADYYTYDWTGPNSYTNSTSDTSIQILNAAPVNSGNYEVTISEENACDVFTLDKEIAVFPNFPSIAVTKDTTNCVAEDTEFMVSGLVPSRQYAIFDGTTGHVHTPINYTASPGIPSVTLEGWFNTSFSGASFNDNWSLFDLDRSEFFGVFIEGDGSIGFSTASSNSIHDMSSAVNGYNDGTWHHVAAVYDGTDKLIYVDGELTDVVENPHAGGNLGLSGDDRFAIIGDGSEATTLTGAGNDIFYDGSIEELRYWETALNGNTIRDWMYKEVNASHPNWANMEAYYQFNGNFDDSRNSNNGIVQGTVTFSGINDFYTYDWTGPNSFSTSVADTIVSVNNVALVDSGFYVAQVENTYCNTDLGKDSAELSIRAESTNVFLLDAATELATVEQCVEGGWTYYTTPAEPDKYLFAIQKNGNSFTANVTLTDIAGTAPIESLGGQPSVRGTWLISRYWNVEVSSGSLSSPVDVRFFIDDTERTEAETDANDFLATTPVAGSIVTPLTWFKTESAAFDPSTDLINGDFTFSPTYLTAGGSGIINGVQYYELTGITSFSGGTGGFSVNNGPSTLPVELISFTAKNIEEEYIQLEWMTATEINNAGFEVQRNKTGLSEEFEAIGWVDGNGNSIENISYLFQDKEAQGNIDYYYRLRQVDFDGQFEFSNIASARLNQVEIPVEIALYPNPTNDGLFTLETNIAGSYKVVLIDFMGRVVLVKEGLQESATQVDVNELSSGIYSVLIQTQGQTFTEKVVISNR